MVFVDESGFAHVAQTKAQTKARRKGQRKAQTKKCAIDVLYNEMKVCPFYFIWLQRQDGLQMTLVKGKNQDAGIRVHNRPLGHHAAIIQL